MLVLLADFKVPPNHFAASETFVYCLSKCSKPYFLFLYTFIYETRFCHAVRGHRTRGMCDQKQKIIRSIQLYMLKIHFYAVAVQIGFITFTSYSMLQK